MTVPTVEDLGNVINRDIDSGDHKRAERILEIAEKTVAGALHMTLADLRSDPPEDAAGITLAVAARAFENPLVLQSESVGPWSGTYTAGGFELTPRESKTLAGIVSSAQGGVFEIALKSTSRHNVDPTDGWPPWVINAPEPP